MGSPILDFLSLTKRLLTPEFDDCFFFENMFLTEENIPVLLFEEGMAETRGGKTRAAESERGFSVVSSGGDIDSSTAAGI